MSKTTVNVQKTERLQKLKNTLLNPSVSKTAKLEEFGNVVREIHGRLDRKNTGFKRNPYEIAEKTYNLIQARSAGTQAVIIVKDREVEKILACCAHVALSKGLLHIGVLAPQRVPLEPALMWELPEGQRIKVVVVTDSNEGSNLMNTLLNTSSVVVVADQYIDPRILGLLRQASTTKEIVDIGLNEHYSGE